MLAVVVWKSYVHVPTKTYGWSYSDTIQPVFLSFLSDFLKEFYSKQQEILGLTIKASLA